MQNEVRCYCGGTLTPNGYMEDRNHREDITQRTWQCDVCGREVSGETVYAMRLKPTKEWRHAHATS
jgi:hypothetical protein